MSKASRGIPGQRVMSRLFTRVAARPTIGTSPAFFARFGLDDPWAFSGFGGGPVDANDPFVFLSASEYYRHMDRQRARQRLMERFRSMEASAAAASALGQGRRSRSTTGAFRASALATASLADAVLVAPLTEAPEAQQDETASAWVTRRGDALDKKTGRKAARASALVAPAERPIARALRQAPSADVAAAPVWRAVAESGLRVGAAERQRIHASLVGVETLADDEQIEVARQVVRRLKGPQRRIAEVIVDEVAASEASAPSRIASSRMTARSTRASAKGLRPVLSSSPTLVGLRFEESPDAEQASVEMPRRNAPVVAPKKAVTARGSHAAPPVVAAARTARTQRTAERAGPVVDVASIVERAVRPVSARSGAGQGRALVSAPADVLSTAPTSVASGPVGRTAPARTSAARASSVAPRLDAVAPVAEVAARRPATERIAARAVAAAMVPPAERVERGTAALDVPAVRAMSRASAAPRRASVLNASDFVAPAPIASEVVAADAVTPAARPASAPRADRSAPAAQAAARAIAPVSRGLERIATRDQAAVGETIAAPATSYVREAPAVAQRIARPVVAGAEPSAAPESSASGVLATAVARVRTERTAARTVRPALAPDAVFARPAAIEASESAAAQAAPKVAARAVAKAPSAKAAARVAPIEVVTPTDRPTQRAFARATPVASERVAAEPLAHARPEAVTRAMKRAETVARPVVAADARTAPATDAIASRAVAPSARAEGVAARGDTVARRSAAVVPSADLVTPAAPEAVVSGETAAPAPRATPTARAVERAEAPKAARTEGERTAERVLARTEGADRAPAPAAKAARARVDAPEAVLARPAALAAETAPAAPVAAPVRKGAPAARHAVRRAEAFTAPAVKPVAEAAVQRAAQQIVARRTVRPAMAHVAEASEASRTQAADRSFRIDVAAPLAAAESRIATASGAATGPVTRASLASVLARVATAVRALERADAPASVSPAVQRTLDEAPSVAPGASAARARRARVAASTDPRLRSIAPSFDGVYAQAPAAPEAVESAVAAPAARVAPAVRPVARAERRAAIGTSTAASRPARRAMAGVGGLSGEALDHMVARSFEPAVQGPSVVRYRTLRTADGRFAPLAPEAVASVAPRFGLGRPEIPSARAARSFEVASGLVLPRTEAVVQPEEPPVAGPVAARTARTAGTVATARAARDGATSAPAAVRTARGTPEARAALATRPLRSFDGTLGRLSPETPASGGGRTAAAQRVAARGAARGAATADGAPTRARTTYDAAGVLVRAPNVAGTPEGAEADDVVGAPVPGYATRAIVGTVAATAGRTSVATRLPPRLATGGLLTALARADRPEEVVQVILARGGNLSDVEAALPEAAQLVERIAAVGGAAQDAAARGAETVKSSAVDSAPLPEFISHRPTGSGSRVRRSASQATPSNGGGSSQVMKLAQKLMNLIHLAEHDRKADDAKRQVRMAEASAEARSEGSASVAAGQTKNLSGDNVNIAALQREVLEAVLQALELNHIRRQEDSDVWW